ncbi:hypothetical protein KUA24_88 [Vibrio phage HNL01]|nr:hypothetical protein KUA24_88 [Vibrio phage HNL01]
MAIVSRNYENVEDYSALMELVPRQDNLLDELGLFSKDFHASTMIELERITAGDDDMYAVARGGNRQAAGRDQSRIEAFRIPLFTLDDTIKPNELQDLREWGTPDAAANSDQKVQRIIKRIQRSHAKLHKAAMYAVITTGKTFAPVDAAGNSLAGYEVDLAAKWGVTRKTLAQDLSAQAVDPTVAIETGVRNHIYTNMGDNSSSTSIIAIVGSGYFNAFTKHALVKEAYLNRDKDAEFLTDRISGNNNRRIWSFDGVTYIEEPDTSVVARNKAYFLPLGLEDMFKLDYAPADTIEHANEVAEEAYLFAQESRRTVSVESEVSLLASCTRPELIVEVTGTLPAGM